jgi:hypothetical protein
MSQAVGCAQELGVAKKFQGHNATQGVLKKLPDNFTGGNESFSRWSQGSDLMGILLRRICFLKQKRPGKKAEP